MKLKCQVRVALYRVLSIKKTEALCICCQLYWHFLKSVSVGVRINKDPSGTFSFMDEESKQAETSFPAWYPEDCWLIILDGTAYLGGLGRTWASYYCRLQSIQPHRLCHTVSVPLHMSLILSISSQLFLLKLCFLAPNPPRPFLHYTGCVGISLPLAAFAVLCHSERASKAKAVAFEWR